MKLYESMFVVDNSRAKENLEEILAQIGEMVARAGGEVVNIDKWDERKLMYEIKRQRRGTYVLCHWNGPPDGPAKLERSSGLSEVILRTLTICDEDGVEIRKPREEARRAGSSPSGGGRWSGDSRSAGSSSARPPPHSRERGKSEDTSSAGKAALPQEGSSEGSGGPTPDPGEASSSPPQGTESSGDQEGSEPSGPGQG